MVSKREKERATYSFRKWRFVPGLLASPPYPHPLSYLDPPHDKSIPLYRLLRQFREGRLVGPVAVAVAAAVHVPAVRSDGFAAGLLLGGELSWRYAWRRSFEGTAADFFLDCRYWEPFPLLVVVVVVVATLSDAVRHAAAAAAAVGAR